jgi:hypothetical protein
MAKSNLENAKHRIGDIKVKNDAMEIAPAIGTKFLVKPTEKPVEKPKTDNTKSGK